MGYMIGFRIPPCSSLTSMSYVAGSCADKQTLVPEYSQSSASSVYANDAMGHSHGQGKLDSPQAWSAGTSAAGQYWQMDLGSANSVGGVVTQGRTAHNQVRTFQHEIWCGIRTERMCVKP